MAPDDPKVKVVLVDDHPMMRNGLRQAMDQRPELALVGETSTGAGALKLAVELAPDLMVVDIHLPDMTGIEASRRILSVKPSTKIIIFTSDAARALVDEALQAGACGYILKSGVAEELMQAIDPVMAGRLYLSPEIGAGILENYRQSLRAPAEPVKPLVSELEKELLRLLTAGRRNKEMAAQLGISTKSVEAYRSRLMKKLGFSGPAELVRYAIREGIAPP